MTNNKKPSIADMPLSELKSLHQLKRVNADDVRAAVSAPFRQFAEQIAAAYNGEEVEYPELSAQARNAAVAQEERAAQERAAQERAERERAAQAEEQARQREQAQRAAAASAAAGGVAQAGFAAQPQPAQPAAKPRDFFAEWEQLQEEEEQKTQVNEADYINIPNFRITAEYQFRQDPNWEAPGIEFEVEVPHQEKLEQESQEEPGYGVEPEPEPEDSDQRHPVRLWWPELEHSPEEVVLYRVVADDSEMVKSPDAGDTLVYTQGTAYRDHTPGEAGLRHYAVWAYKGRDLRELVNSQPVFMGDTGVVFPPVNVQVSTIKGAIQVSWDLLPGHSSAMVYACRDSEKEKLSPRFEQDVDSSGRKATIPVQEAGQTVVISLLGQAEFRGATEQSQDEVAVQRSVKLASELEKLELSRCERRVEYGQDTIEVDWYSPKTGEVKIYLTPTAPQADLRTSAVPKTYVESALSSAISETRGVSEPGSFQTTTVPWPPDWYEVYITPVNFNDADAWVGESKVLQRVQSIEDDQLRLIERVDSQLITFDWPKGATAVEYSTNREHDQIREEDYDLQGGIRLHLDQHGDTVRLKPYAVFAGKRTEGNERVIQYEGLRPVTYDFEVDYTQGQVRVFLWSLGNGDKRQFSCQVVYRADRLPLFPEDGEALGIVETNLQSTTHVAQGLGPMRGQHPDFTVALGERIQREGFIRLFAVEGFDSQVDTSFDSFGGEDAFSGFAESYSDASSTLSASDKAVVVEGDVSYKLAWYPPVQNQTPSYEAQYDEQNYGQQNYGQDYSQDQYFQGGQ